MANTLYAELIEDYNQTDMWVFLRNVEPACVVWTCGISFESLIQHIFGRHPSLLFGDHAPPSWLIDGGARQWIQACPLPDA